MVLNGDHENYLRDTQVINISVNSSAVIQVFMWELDGWLQHAKGWSDQRVSWQDRLRLWQVAWHAWCAENRLSHSGMEIVQPSLEVEKQTLF